MMRKSSSNYLLGQTNRKSTDSTAEHSQNGSNNNSNNGNNNNDNFRVVIRVRPPLPRELLENGTFENAVRVENPKEIVISENLPNYDGGGTFDDGICSQHQFTFDRVYDMDSNQFDVYMNTARDAVFSTLEGYNATIIAYGQTGTGKTFTMEGFTNNEKRGIIPRSTEEIFNFIQTSGNPKTRFLVRASYLQIYKDVISDLLKPERTNLIIREDKKKGVYVENLSEWVVRSPSEIYSLMDRGAKVRATGSTRLNELSSRSHAVFIMIVEQNEQCVVDENGNEVDLDEYRAIVSETGEFRGEVREVFKIGKLNLVDLAGSERVRYSGATGRSLDESKKINQSLSALGNVIAALTDPRGRQHIPYRDSKLTRLLEDSLGGNCRTTMIAMISPALEAFAESLSTLKFANRAKSIKNEAHINEDLDQRALLRKYENELKKLRNELQNKTKDVVDKKKLLELEQAKKRAEDDKMAAISALTKKTEEFVREQQIKRDLEHRIATMQSQLLVGGEKIQETPMFKNLLKKEHERVHKIYLNKMQALERERQSIEEDKAQVDRYKQLLLKQRDIMIALTARLNERDEYILNLQEELDAYDRHQKMLEDTVTQKNELIRQYESSGSLVGGVTSIAGHMTSGSEDKYVLASTIQQLNEKLRRSYEENERLSQQYRIDREELQKLQLRLSSSTVGDDGNQQQPFSIIDKQQIQMLKQQCITKEKEKQALRTILETRVAPELEKIYGLVSQLLSKQNRDQVEEARGTISDLSELLNASIAALAIRKTPSTPITPSVVNTPLPNVGYSSSSMNMMNPNVSYAPSTQTPSSQIYSTYQSGFISSTTPTNTRYQ